MFGPDDPLAPPKGVFDEPWQATVLAMAVAMIRAGHVTQGDWANALGEALSEAEAAGEPDTNHTYFTAALTALERVSEQSGITPDERDTRKAQWEAAFRTTPHGKPVSL